MSEESGDFAETIEAPFGKTVELMEIPFGDADRLLRVRIREKSRFTTVDLDPHTAERWGRALIDWAEPRLPKDEPTTDRG